MVTSESRGYARKAISLPLYPGLKQEEQEYVIDTLHGLLRT